jgi:hypothetical protein
MLRRVALVRTDVSEERIASIIKVTNGELGTTLAITSKRSTLGRNSDRRFCHPDDGGDTFFRNACSYKSHTA